MNHHAGAQVGVVAELVGGLGNQMFQYAAGRALADRLGVDLGLDLRWFRTQDSRHYGLGAFAVRAVVVPDGVYGSFRPVVHPGVEFSDVLSHAGPDTWLRGYWQSERYFAAIADRVRADLSVKQVLGATKAIERRIRGMACPVAVHVRRGDYASVPATRAFHGLCSVEYYERAMSHVRSRDPGATFVFFSDDPRWVADTFKPAPENLINLVGARPEEDLHLMTTCRAHIISNSTFGWWGAWLAAAETVVAPAEWYQAPGIGTPDIVPARWTRL